MQIITALILLAACLQAQPKANPLAPTGTLRAAFLGDNPVLGRLDAAGTVTGPVADLVKEMALRAGVPYTLIPAAGARDIMDRLKAGTADIGFMAYNAGRAQDVDFSPAWLLMPNAYIVRADSLIQKSADADLTGVMIAAVQNDTQDVFLRNNLKNAKIKQLPAMPTVDDIAKMLTGKEVDAFAANRQRLLEAAERHSSLRVIPDSYFVAGQAIATAKGDAARSEAVNTMLRQILATDLVKTAIEHAGLKGVEAAH